MRLTEKNLPVSNQLYIHTILIFHSEPPLIIKPSYEIPVVNQGVSEERLDDRLGELKNWIESELLHKLIEGRTVPVLHGHRRPGPHSNLIDIF